MVTEGPGCGRLGACAWGHCLDAKAVLGRQRWSKVKCDGISSNYPVSAMLRHTWAWLATGWRAGEELNNENNCNN